MARTGYSMRNDYDYGVAEIYFRCPKCGKAGVLKE
jgi:hypothetical protein